jgi:hypothetical protein
MALLDKQDRKLFGLLLKPSWLSGLIAVVAGLAVSLGVILAFSFNTSAVSQQLARWQQDQPAKPLTQPGQIVTAEGRPQLKDTWPLLIFWAAIGLVVYGITASVVHSASDAEKLRESLGYVNANPRKQLQATAGHLFLKLVAFVIFVVFALVFYKEIVPYAITAAHASAVDIQSGTGVLYMFLSFAIVAVSLHLFTTQFWPPPPL